MTAPNGQRLMAGLTKEGADRLHRDAKAGVQGADPTAQWLLNLARARQRWPEDPREALRGYLQAFDEYIQAFDPECHADLETPLAEAADALASLANGKATPWWLKRVAPEGRRGKPPDGTGPLFRRALATAAVNRIVHFGGEARQACRDVARAVEVTAKEVENWREDLNRQRGAQNPEAQRILDECREWLRDHALAEVVPALRRAMKDRFPRPSPE
jgi:hypothetical protein